MACSPRGPEDAGDRADADGQPGPNVALHVRARDQRPAEAVPHRVLAPHPRRRADRRGPRLALELPREPGVRRPRARPELRVLLEARALATLAVLARGRAAPRRPRLLRR